MDSHNHDAESLGFSPPADKVSHPVSLGKPTSVRRVDIKRSLRAIVSCCLAVVVLSVLGAVGGASYVWYSCSGGLNEEVDVEVTNVPPDARFVCVGGGDGNGIPFVVTGVFRVFQGKFIQTPEPDSYRPNFAAETDGDFSRLEHREWQEDREYVIIVEDKQGHWRVWQVKRSEVTKHGHTVRFTIPDRPPGEHPYDWERRLNDQFPRSVRGVEADTAKEQVKP
jgi:hypothetical protein